MKYDHVISIIQLTYNWNYIPINFFSFKSNLLNSPLFSSFPWIARKVKVLGRSGLRGDELELKLKTIRCHLTKVIFKLISFLRTAIYYEFISNNLADQRLVKLVIKEDFDEV